MSSTNPERSAENTFAAGWIDRLAEAQGDLGGRLRHLEVMPARAASYADWPEWAHPSVVAGYGRLGIDRPWTHQAVAAEAVHDGQHTVISTGTASGKSLAYQLPALTAILDQRRDRGERGASVLYVSPTKALARDQLARIEELGLGIRACTHDGDSTREERAWTRDFGEYVLTNPDMVHRSVLPAHPRWAELLRRLRYVVIDECHHYRGVFGAHVAHVIRRLLRIARAYGAEPVVVLASATVAEPEGFARELIGADVLAVTADHSPRGRLAVALWEPPLTERLGEGGAPLRLSATTETADLLTALVRDRVRTLAFVRSRRAAEQVALAVSDRLAGEDPGLVGTVAAYRGGYLPEERRALEAALRSGRLRALATTNALELGIDVSGLDAVLVAGWPGTRAALWQQWGRAGRAASDALGVLIARDDPLDTYVVNHPGSILGAPLEATVIDVGNPTVLAPQLCAAAFEAPLTEAELPSFHPGAAVVIDQLVAAGVLRRRAGGFYWTDATRPADLVDIRSGGAEVSLIEGSTGRLVGTVDGSSADATAHAGAVLLHQGETWVVDDLDLGDRVATMHRDDVDHATSARSRTEITIEGEQEHAWWGSCRLSFGRVAVSTQVTSYLKRRVPSGEVLGEFPLDLPVRTLSTAAVWWTVPDDVLAESDLLAADLPGAAHAAEHCSIGLLPLFATCDRWDIGGVSTARHQDTGVLTVFVHDGHPGGAGFAERGFRAAAPWLRATRSTIADCECPSGCPSCVQSPKCGNGNNPLDKEAALRLLDVLLADAPAG